MKHNICSVKPLVLQCEINRINNQNYFFADLTKPNQTKTRMLRKVKVFNNYYRKLFSHYSGSKFGYSMLMFFFINSCVFAQIYITESTIFYVADGVSNNLTLDSLTVDSSKKVIKADVYVLSDTKIIGFDKVTAVNLIFVENKKNVKISSTTKIEEKNISENSTVEDYIPEKKHKTSKIVWNNHFPKSQFVNYSSFNNVSITVTKKHTEVLNENNCYGVENNHLEKILIYFEASKYYLALNNSINIRPPPFEYNS